MATDRGAGAKVCRNQAQRANFAGAKRAQAGGAGSTEVDKTEFIGLRGTRPETMHGKVNGNISVKLLDARKLAESKGHKKLGRSNRNETKAKRGDKENLRTTCWMGET